MPLPVPPPTLETAPVAEVSLDYLLPLADLVESWPGLRLVLGDLPADSSTSSASVLGRLAVELSKAGALDAELATVRAGLAIS